MQTSSRISYGASHLAPLCLTSALLVHVGICLGCDRPPVTLEGDDAGAMAPPAPLGVAIDPSLGLPSFIAPAASAGPTPEEWSSPPACPLSSEDAHCERCWSHTDGGPASLDRDEVADAFGTAAAVGDFNGDGYPDLAVGAPAEDTDEDGAGLVYVYLGSDHGFQPWQVLDDGDLGGPTEDAGFGGALRAGDLDGDDLADLIVGYAGDLEDAPIAVFRGSPTGLILDGEVHLSEVDAGGATQASARFGSVLAARDTNNDGVLDLVAVSAPYLSGGGRVYVLENDSGSLSVDHVITGSADWGTALEYLDDDLLAVSGPAVDSTFPLYAGTSSSQFVLTNYSTRSGWGRQIRLVLAGFGSAQIVAVGADEGPVEIHLFGSGSFTSYLTDIAAPVADPWSGSTRLVADADLNNDGEIDFVVAHDDGDPRLFVLYGDGEPTAPDCWAYDDPSPCWFELDLDGPDGLGAVGLTPDLDGAGGPDLVVSAPSPSTSEGRVYTYVGAAPADWDDTLQPSQTITQETALPIDCDRCYVYSSPDGTVCDDVGDYICVLESCVERGCGDGYREPGPTPARESCDDANLDETDGCTSMCESQPLVISTGSLTASSPAQYPTAVAEDSHESLLFVYVYDGSLSEPPGAVELRGQRTLRTGERVGEPLVLATLDIGWDPQASVAGGDDGWVVVWRDPRIDGDDAGIAMRRVLADGTLLAPRQANGSKPGPQFEPRIVDIVEGFVVAWTDEGGVDGPLGESLVEARRFDRTLTALEDEWPLGSSELSTRQPVLASHDGRWLAVFTEETTSGSRILARRFGGSEGSDLAPTEITADGASPAAAYVDGVFVVAWVHRDTDFVGDIAARSIDAGATPTLGAVTDITLRTMSDPPHAELAPSIAALSGGEYLVAYEDGGYRRGLAYAHVGMSTLAVESTDLDGYLVDGFQGDVTLLRTGRGVWFAWSDAILGDPDAYRSFIAYLLPES